MPYSWGSWGSSVQINGAPFLVFCMLFDGMFGSHPCDCSSPSVFLLHRNKQNSDFFTWCLPNPRWLQNRRALYAGREEPVRRSKVLSAYMGKPHMITRVPVTFADSLRLAAKIQCVYQLSVLVCDMDRLNEFWRNHGYLLGFVKLKLIWAEKLHKISFRP